MSFNIHELDNIDIFEDQREKRVERYQDTLLEQFYNSPEGEKRQQHIK